MKLNITIDTKDFNSKLAKVEKELLSTEKAALGEMGDELLRLSSFEVPLDTGHLQDTGNVKKEQSVATVGYNTPYAARLHEHPGYRFQKGRKGKYLEDPLKQNLTKWQQIYSQKMGEIL